ncbi:MAG: hypothetical protein P4L33_15735 [Capsulimonadaceae bacterium]|nr:hypothetical protein [Capsulimonadaceae bacterium]
MPNLPRHNDYAGAAHIHSTYSDGTARVPEIAAAGARAGLDFILFGDHNTLDARRDGEEIWQAGNRVLIIIGSEITCSEGHLLAYDTPLSFFPAPHDAVECMKAIHACGGYGYIALPCDLKGHWGDYSLRQPGIGIELNLSSIARTKINVPGFLMALLRYRGKDPLSAYSFIAGRPDDELKLWDTMLAEAVRRDERLPQIVGCLDAHAVMRIFGREWPYPSYEESFRTLRTHVLTTEALSFSNETVERDIDVVHDALRNGRCYASYDNFGDPRGFLVELRHKGEYVGTTGTTYEIGPDAQQGSYVLAVRAPRTRTVIRIIRDGLQVVSRRGGALDYPVTQPGIYRVEVLIYRRRVGNLCFGARPWIFSNALHVKLRQPSPASKPSASTLSLSTDPPETD